MLCSLTNADTASSSNPSSAWTGRVITRYGPQLHYAKLLAPMRKIDLDPRADTNLAPAPDLALSIDPHHAAGYQRLGLAAVSNEIGELEQLPQTNGVPANFDLHPASLDYRLT